MSYRFPQFSKQSYTQQLKKKELLERERCGVLVAEFSVFLCCVLYTGVCPLFAIVLLI